MEEIHSWQLIAVNHSLGADSIRATLCDIRLDISREDDDELRPDEGDSSKSGYFSECR
jgi:hypothetical protein